MKTCPRCSFLMGDGESLCSSCTAQPDRTFPLDDFELPDLGPSVDESSGAAAGSTLLLQRPPAATSRTRSEVRYRDVEKIRRNRRAAALLVVVAVAAGALGALALRGQGPLASTAVSLGLADPPLVDVPGRWTTKVSTDGQFDVELPVGAVEHTELVDPALPEMGSYKGYQVELGEQAEMFAMTTHFGLGRERLRKLDDAAFAALVDETIARSGFGTETVRRSPIVRTGRAIDSVLAEGDHSTARIRFLLIEGNFHVLMTRGSEAGARKLDEAHRRLLDGFESTI